MDTQIFVCFIILSLIIIPPLIWGVVVRIIAKLRPLKKIRIRVGDKTGIIDLESDELIVRQIERIKKGEQ